MSSPVPIVTAESMPVMTATNNDVPVVSATSSPHTLPQTTTTTTTTVVSFTRRQDRRGCCSWIGNLLWLLLGGWHMFLSWMVVGLILCVTCIFIPCGVQCIKIAFFLLCPFGKTVVYDGQSGHGHGNNCCSNGCNCILNILWACTAGWILALQAFITGILLCFTIIGIPFGIQCFKLMQLCFCPFGKDFSSLQENTTTVTRTSYNDYHAIP